MKKILIVALVSVLTLSACIPGILEPQADTAAPVDLQATVEHAASTKAAETIVSLPTPTLEPPTLEPPTPEPTATEQAATETAAPTETESEPPDAGTPSGTPDGTLPAETDTTETPEGTITPKGTITPEETPTLQPPTATETSIYPSPTSPISINEPPSYVPRYRIKVVNKSGVRAYISLQGYVDVDGGYYPIIEYDLNRWEKTNLRVPKGYYTCIVYVGSDPMVKTFGVYSNNAATVVIYKDKVNIVR